MFKVNMFKVNMLFKNVSLYKMKSFKVVRVTGKGGGKYGAGWGERERDPKIASRTQIVE